MAGKERPSLPQGLPDSFSLVAPELSEVEDLIRRPLKHLDPYLRPAAENVLARPGKRLRPGTFLLLVKALGQEPGLAHLVVGAVLELCHTATLLHDDVLDEAELRRGQLSLRAQRGNREAILFGDHLFATAFGLLADLGRPEILSVVSELIRRVCQGEIRQWALRGLGLTRDDYLSIVRAKTASFFRFGGTLAALLTRTVQPLGLALEAWGDAFGTAYQIYDDLYDLSLREGATKSLGRDVRLGLLTLPWIWLREKAGRKILKKLYFQAREGVPPRGDPDFGQALTLTLKDLNSFLTEAEKALGVLPEGSARNALLSLGKDLSAKADRLVGELL